MSRRLRIFALPALVAVLLPAGALAASLGVASIRVTVRVSATSIPAKTCTLTASADTYADQLLTLSNFGGSADLLVRSEALRNKRAFVGFDLSSCTIPSAAEVKSATLRLTLASAPASSRTYGASRITESWSEGGLTWSDQPSVGGVTASTSTGTTSGATLSWNVRTDVANYVSGAQTNNGWQIADAAEGAVVGIEGALGSRESGQKPQLEIVYYP